MPAWRMADMPDQTMSTVVITGANSGIGKQTARAMLERGARVVLACRDVAAGTAALSELTAAPVPGTGVVRALDLSDLTDVARFARQSAQEDGPLTGLVANAGIMAGPRRSTAQGYELQMGTNHLGHAALVSLLWPQLDAAPRARVVLVSSVAARGGRLDATMTRETLVDPVPYAAQRVYSNTKQANLLHAQELHRRASSAGRSILVLAAHPGISATNLLARQLREQGLGLLAPVASPALRVLFQSATAGALPTLRALTDPDARGGQFYGPRGPGQTRGAPVALRLFASGAHPAVAARLWELTDEVVAPHTGASLAI